MVELLSDKINLTTHCLPNPASTFLMRVSGTSMVEAGIFDQDYIAVDRSVDAKHGDIVVASLNMAG